jgi:hypothetical protein
MFTITNDNLRSKINRISRLKSYADGLDEGIEYIEWMGLDAEPLKVRKETFIKNAEILSKNIENFIKETQ